MKRVKVLLLVNELLRGGAQGIVLDLSRRIDRGRFDVVVATLKPGGEDGLGAALEKEGVRVRALSGGPRFTLREARALHALLREEQPDILHTFLPYAGTLGRIVGRAAGVPRIVSTQCNLPVAYDAKTYWLDRLTLPLADAWIGATESIERSYAGSYAYFDEAAWRGGRRHFTIAAGVDLSAFDERVARADGAGIRRTLGIPSGETLILTVARLVSWKGNGDLIAAFARLSGAPHLALVGWGPLEAELREQATREGIAARVHFLGARSDVPELLAAATIYAQAHGRAADRSIWEGPNTSQMEACAARVPSVSTRVPLIELLIEEGATGALAAPNDPASIADAIERLRKRPEEARAMAARARARVEERYSVERMAASHEMLYASLIPAV